MFATFFLSRLDARDRALFQRWAMFDGASRKARWFWRTMTHLGGASVTLAASTLPVRAGGAMGLAAFRSLVLLVVSHLVVQLVKRTVNRPRPSNVVAHCLLAHEPDRFSFPSGHSAAAMSVALAYSVTFPQAGVVLIPLAVLVGLSRVCLGVHYPGDVFIGQLIAVLTAAPMILR